MEFIKGAPMQHERNRITGKMELKMSRTTAYINPAAIESAVYDPSQEATFITIRGSEERAALKGDVMRDYEKRMRRQDGDGE